MTTNMYSSQALPQLRTGILYSSEYVNAEKPMPKNKSLEDKAIDIKGKKYVLVSDRIIYFNEEYLSGSITTELVTDPESDSVIVKATIRPNPDVDRTFTGYSQAIKGDGFINKTAALENAETSAVGRALAMMGIGVIDSVASVDEINKAQGSQGKRNPMSEKQKDWIRSEARKASGHEHNDDVDKWIEEVLTIPLNQVPGFKTKSAVDKIQAVGKQLEKDVVVEVPEGQINLDEVPY